ncbi:hypothetical protein BDP55DRAFT_631976 [Colletotrichum godetiae]|uniref:Secreted protein n=1 Tax=Colletotrichum godetiae TaxID=1209918 RepID=A0AAJ0AKY1_9PEZI|nr:uncharacterized protein BDP55DRAFT_631976 [Colletotrichum godetiae]KAK1675795.1 hypothetical protein BDP55DRAFT_631976 [Colletotrichum godetiae]
MLDRVTWPIKLLLLVWTRGPWPDAYCPANASKSIWNKVPPPGRITRVIMERGPSRSVEKEEPRPKSQTAMREVTARRADRSAAQGDRLDQNTIRWLAVPYPQEAYLVHIPPFLLPMAPGAGASACDVLRLRSPVAATLSVDALFMVYGALPSQLKRTENQGNLQHLQRI